MNTQTHDIEKNGIEPTRLCTHRDTAESINVSKMKENKGDMKVYYAKDSHPEYTETMDKSLQAHRKLVLKVGAQVCKEIISIFFIIR